MRSSVFMTALMHIQKKRTELEHIYYKMENNTHRTNNQQQKKKQKKRTKYFFQVVKVEKGKLFKHNKMCTQNSNAIIILYTQKVFPSLFLIFLSLSLILWHIVFFSNIQVFRIENSGQSMNSYLFRVIRMKKHFFSDCKLETKNKKVKKIRYNVDEIRSSWHNWEKKNELWRRSGSITVFLLKLYTRCSFHKRKTKCKKSNVSCVWIR